MKIFKDALALPLGTYVLLMSHAIWPFPSLVFEILDLLIDYFLLFAAFLQDTVYRVYNIRVFYHCRVIEDIFKVSLVEESLDGLCKLIACEEFVTRGNLFQLQ